MINVWVIFIAENLNLLQVDTDLPAVEILRQGIRASLKFASHSSDDLSLIYDGCVIL